MHYVKRCLKKLQDQFLHLKIAQQTAQHPSTLFFFLFFASSPTPQAPNPSPGFRHCPSSTPLSQPRGLRARQLPPAALPCSPCPCRRYLGGRGRAAGAGRGAGPGARRHGCHGSGAGAGPGSLRARLAAGGAGISESRRGPTPLPRYCQKSRSFTT